MEGRRGGNIMRKKCPTCLSKQAFPAIECSFCRYQFHLYCLGIVSDPPLDIEVFYCSNCERKYNKETKIMTDHLDFLKDVSEEPRRIGSKEFLENFKKKTFLSADDIPIVRLAGKDANLGYIETHGFETPILVHSSDGLRLKVPNQDFSYKDLLENIGPLKELIVIDVSRQKEEVMYLRELVEYLSRDERPKAINMLSLEFSSTRFTNHFPFYNSKLKISPLQMS